MIHSLKRLIVATILVFPIALHAIEISEGTYDGRAQFVVKTKSATYYFDRAGGGFSRLIDRDGHDWIAFSKDPLMKFPDSAAAGYRGMPNAVFGGDNPDAGAGHPGFDQCASELVGKSTIRTESKSGKWVWTWSFTETAATMEMVKADPNHSWWFLYEGPIGGSFNPKNKFWGTSNGGSRTDIPNIKEQFFDQFQWIYFGDRDTSRVLFITQHTKDELDDTVWYLGSSEGGAATAPDGMVVFGFGRGNGTKPLLKGAGKRFSVGFVNVDSADPSPPDLNKRIERAVESTLVKNAPAPWPEGVKEIGFHATADGSIQNALFRPARSLEPRPLLVALHSWSGNYLQSDGTKYVTRCFDRDWHFIHPDFRGANRKPSATCSDFVVSDILDAVAYAKQNANVDEARVYLIGVSGGGMASLMMLAKAPDVWTAVSSWVPISDLAQWHHDTKSRNLHYADWIESSCDGAPGDSPAVDFQYWNRSPVNFLEHGRGVPLDLNAGITDGHSESVPISHSLNAFNRLALENDQIGEELIQSMVKDAEVPEKWRWQSTDESYGKNTVLFRRKSESARVTLFQGGHEINHDAAFAWLEKQQR